jgi:hypothetical protein
MQTIAKITPADYPDLLAAADAGIPQRELANRYDCAPSLIARHLAKAERARALGELTPKRDRGPAAETQSGSMREILEARIRDPQTSARDLASLINALARAREEEERTSHPFLSYLRSGTLILEPGPAGGDGDRRYRLMLRARGGIEHVSSSQYDLTPADALYLIVCWLGSGLGLTLEDILGTTAAPAQ